MFRTFRFLIYIAGVLISLGTGLCVYAQLASRQTSPYFNLLYWRTPTLPQESKQDVSAIFHHLFMAYWVDSLQPSVLEDMSRMNLMAKKYPEAIQSLEKAYQTSGNDLHLGRTLLDLYLGMQMKEKAAQVGEELMKLTPEDPSLLNRMAKIYAEGKKYDQALNTLDQILKTGINAPELYTQKAEILLQQGKKEEAQNLLQQYEQENIADKTVALTLASFYVQHQQPDKALLAIENHLKVLPNNFEALAVKAAIEVQRKKYKQGTQTILRASQIEGVTPEALQTVLSQTYAQSQQAPEYGEALVPVLQELCKQFPNSDSFSAQLGTLLLQKKKTETKGIELLQELVNKNTGVLAPYLILATRYGEAENTDSLLLVSQKAIANFPEEATFQLYTILGWFQKGDTVQALQVAQKALKEVPEDAPQYSRLLSVTADLLNEQGKPQEAFELYAKAVMLNPNDPTTLNNYAYALATDGKPEDLERAEQMASQAVKIAPTQASFLDTYAWILYLRGEYALAKVYQENALSHAEEPSALYFEHYGDILIKLGDTQGALQAYQKALPLSLDPKKIEERINALKTLQQQD